MGVLHQISASQTGLHQCAWLLARQVDFLEFGFSGDLVTRMTMRQMLWQAPCSSGKWDETSCGFQESWQLFSQSACGHCWLGLGLEVGKGSGVKSHLQPW